MPNWHELIPAHIAELQKAWDRRQTVLRMHEAGLEYREVGARMGLSIRRASSMGVRAKVERQMVSPVEAYLNQKTIFGDVVRLGMVPSHVLRHLHLNP